MSIGNTKRRAEAASRVMASALVGIALLVLVGAGVYSKARGIGASVSESGSQGFENTAVNEAETASNIPTGNIPTDGASSALQKTKSAPQAPPQPSQPPQPDQPPQPSQAPNPSTVPNPSQAPHPSTAPNPSQAPHPSTAPNPSQAPQPSTAPNPSTVPKPSQAPQPAHAPEPPQHATAAAGVGHGQGIGVGRGISGGIAGGVGQATPVAPSTIATPASPVTAPAAPALPAKQEKSKSKSREERSDQKSRNKVHKGDLIEAPHPVYPVEARRQQIEGKVTVAIVIGEDGNVISAKAKSGPELLYGASQEAAYKARFKPTLVNGKPAEVAAAMTYNFVIDRK